MDVHCNPPPHPNPGQIIKVNISIPICLGSKVGVKVGMGCLFCFVYPVLTGGLKHPVYSEHKQTNWTYAGSNNNGRERCSCS